ncbi:hypothetical protein A1O7_08360 [Cladophialophora yegresii CBS 114405]|uniref:DhaK domain-containing protein n=1 Tax=Cladophialophora yegresii CBS 114405 TaxID=1182544 RepID=W9VIX0_9EURO|nr:uncharacterized protein A1O7_08360 [Cladophialophora yegresii CBS 114405]EXJ55433.1 hypothetical protein A1O7_08360 [Cladophialophora yegresii CBS 114405]
MASDGVSLLDLPAHYGLKVSDMVHFRSKDSGSGSPTSTYPYEDFTAGAGMLLVCKIIDALRRWDAHGIYTDEDIAKVGSLVTSNVKTVHSAQVRNEIARVTCATSEGTPSAWDIRRLAVETLLGGLLDRDVMRDSAVHVNSNEPVVLVNLDGDKAGHLDAERRDMLNYVVDIVTTELRSKWNILPVRVYGGHGLPMPKPGYVQAEVDEVSVPGFSITLLNVVNTDIGGPSMPQLLDAPCDATEWRQVIRKELWRERELISREDHDFVSDQQVGVTADADNASEHSLKSEDDDDGSVGSDAPRLATTDSPPQIHVGSPAQEPELTEFGGGAEEGHHTGQTTEEPQTRDSQPPAHHDNPAAGDGSDRDTGKQDLAETETEGQTPRQDIPLPEPIRIEHPTWDRHDDSTSLLDLMKAQASMIAPFGAGTAGHSIADVEGDVAVSKAEDDAADVKSASPESGSKAEVVEPAAAGAPLPKDTSPSDDEYEVV